MIVNCWQQFVVELVRVLAWPMTAYIIATMGIRAWVRSFEKNED